MSLNFALGNALTGLKATARMAEVVSANLANALTEGYARRGVELGAASIDGRGAGVRVDGIARSVDRGLLAARRDAEGGMGGREALAQGLSALEAALGSAEAGTSLAARLTALEEALVAASADPSSEPRLARVMDRLQGVAGALNEADAAVARGRAKADAAIAAQVDGLNADLQGIDRLNRDVGSALAAGRDATGLMDQRQALIDRVAAVVPVREMDRANGQVALITPQGATLLDGRPATVGFTGAPVITAGMTLASGALAGLTLNGEPMTPAGVGRLAGGTLEAAFDLRDGALPAAQAKLDALARDLLERFAGADPTLAAADPGPLTDGGDPFDPAAVTGLAGRIGVNGALTADPSLLRDGLNAPAPRPAGDATQIDAWIAALGAPRPLATGGPAGAAATLAAAVEGEVAQRRLHAEEEASFAAARWSGLKEAELADGVDSDHEMQMLLRIEQAYAANAKVIAAVDEMMQTLMRIG